MSGIIQAIRRMSASSADDFVVVPPAAPSAGGPTVTLSLKQKYSTIPAAGTVKGNSYVATLKAAAVVNEDARAPIDVSVVMDISGSMSGQKLELCKKTTLVLLNELKIDDRFSLVVFGNEARTVFPLQFLTAANKVNAESSIKRLSTDGCTNLSGGLTLGLQELQGCATPNQVRSVLLLTDGHANRGVSDATGIVNLLKGCIESSPNISVNTFGYGADHNADLLKAISEVSSTDGSYYFIETEDNVSSAFGDCIGGLLSVTAQNIKLRVRETNGQAIKVLHEKAQSTSPSSWTVSLGDIFADESKDFVIVLEAFTGPTATIEAQVEYVDIVNSATVTSPIATITTDLAAEALSAPDHYVILQTLRVLVAGALKTAGTTARGRNMPAARALINQTVETVTNETKDIKLDEVGQLTVTTLLADLNSCLSGLSSYDEYERHGSKMMSTKMQTHSAQRSNESNEQSYNLYRAETSNKARFARKMKGNMGNVSEK